ncbi:MAG: NAD(P)H-quinone oxidoreductase [Alphaproteobacteria bacterium 32-64-14]|nr:MAG: NAD(P)H-quinone oxidoreductase [Alphaproteobacteria bacterium 32-64-14]
MMKAVKSVVGQPLTLHEIEKPTPGPGQVLIRVHAAGVNRPDLIQRAGKYPPPPGAPETLGLEVSGVVEAIGDGVTLWKGGEKVCALVPGGGYAEFAVAHEGSTMPLPAPLSFVEAAGLPETVLTVWNNVFHMAQLKPGESLLIHGGASGIGTTAIQLARAWGATVYATAGTDEKCRLCESLGARQAINYRTEDFETVLRDAGGVDVVLDMVGKPYFEKNLTILKDLGRLTYIAFLQGSRIEGDLTRLMLKRISVSGSTLRIRTNEHKAMLAAGAVKHAWPWIAAGKFKPLVSGVFTLAEADAAHAKMEATDHTGKIILQVAP